MPTRDILGRRMASGTYERLTTSRAGTAVKAWLRKLAPGATARMQRAIRAGRRAWREPPMPALSPDQQIWSPPPRRVREWPLTAGEVSERLFSRLTETDLRVMLERLHDEDRAVWQEADESARRVVAVHFCVHYQVPGVLEKTGLSAAAPPPKVTIMGQGSLAAGGSMYYADLVADALRRAGADLGSVRRVLDFGCSSARIVRVLSAVYPEVEWAACDPDAGAIAWASQAFPGVRFFVSEVEPPLPFPDSHLDAAYAIGIWSHYSEAAAVRWLEEMRRIVRPGGHLVLTAHGYRSVEMHAGEWGQWPAEMIADTVTRLYTHGHKFVGGYGKGLSLAQSTPDWGEAFFTPEWLADRACPNWAIVDYDSGRVEGNHDLYVLERRR